MNLGTLLEMVVAGAGDRVIVGSRETGLTASAIAARARGAASRFALSGASHVSFIDENSNALPIALFGAALAGLPFAPLNYRLADGPLATLVARLAPTAIVAPRTTLRRIDSVDGVANVEPMLLTEPLQDEPPAAGSEPDPESVAVLLFTSGTTGAAKAALLRHRHLVSYVISTVDFMSAEEHDAQLVAMPPYHVAGMTTILTSMYAGRRIVYLPAFDAQRWVETITSEAITHAMVVPTMLGRILDVLEATNTGLPSLRHLAYGGGRMPIDVIQRALTLLPDVAFVNAYGLTETSSTISVLDAAHHRSAIGNSDPQARARLGSVGRPVPGVAVEIRGLDGTVLGPDSRGEIYVRGDQIAGEYSSGPALTDEGWFPTRDAGYFDADGFLFLDGRLDDVIVRGGENLSPGEIEDVLVAHPSVRDACVVGVRDPAWGESVAAVVVIEPGATATADDLKTWVSARLRSTKTPERIEFRSSLPYNDTGKLLRRVIRAELANSSG